ncbi:hypothetical protein [Paenibacillus macquariensis]|uniref:hypothetical protein n=1 Tax=Paenibacillus macquariensis TaxID=948756 RepID=UPI0007C406D9|nr:hypothetical protein [Paenibacillus macquariensis]OAB32290.1 hypothetical protein PMSM_16915 [Paenibacillus macquariensis subsp. macquariensis]
MGITGFGFLMLFSNAVFGFILILIGLFGFTCSCAYSLLSFKGTMGKMKVSTERAFSTVPDFTPTKKYVSSFNGTILAIDEHRNKIVVSVASHNYIFINKNIRTTEVLMFNGQLSKRSKSGMLGGAIVGELLAGSTGAIIGGLSANRTIETTTRGIFLKILIDDIRMPTFEIPFFVSSKEVSIKDFKVSNAISEANRWNDILINSSQQPTVPTDLKFDGLNDDTVQRNRHYLQDELKKIEELLELREISSDEYQSMKNRLISK